MATPGRCGIPPSRLTSLLDPIREASASRICITTSKTTLTD